MIERGTQVVYNSGGRGRQFGFVTEIHGPMAMCRFWGDSWGLLRTTANSEPVYIHDLIIQNSGPQEVVLEVLFKIEEAKRNEVRKEIEFLEGMFRNSVFQ